MSEKNTSGGIFVEDLKKLKTLRRMRKTIPPKRARGREPDAVESARTQDGLFYVCDGDNARVTKIDGSGKVVGFFGVPGNGLG